MVTNLNQKKHRQKKKTPPLPSPQKLADFPKAVGDERHFQSWILEPLANSSPSITKQYSGFAYMPCNSAICFFPPKVQTFEDWYSTCWWRLKMLFWCVFFIIKLNINSLILEWFADFKTSLLNPLMITFVHIWCLKYLVQREQRHLPRTTPTNPKNLLPEITNPKNGFDAIHPLRSFVPGSQNCCHSPTSAPAKSIEGSTFQLSSNDVTQNGGAQEVFEIFLLDY